MLRIVPRVWSFSRLPRASVSRCSLELPGILPWSLTIWQVLSKLPCPCIPGHWESGPHTLILLARSWWGWRLKVFYCIYERCSKLGLGWTLHAAIDFSLNWAWWSFDIGNEKWQLPGWSESWVLATGCSVPFCRRDKNHSAWRDDRVNYHDSCLWWLGTIVDRCEQNKINTSCRGLWWQSWSHSMSYYFVVVNPASKFWFWLWSNPD